MRGWPAPRRDDPIAGSFLPGLARPREIERCGGPARDALRDEVTAIL